MTDTVKETTLNEQFAINNQLEIHNSQSVRSKIYLLDYNTC